MDIIEVIKNLYSHHQYVIDENGYIVSIYDIYEDVKNDMKLQNVPDYFKKNYFFLELETDKIYNFKNSKYIIVQKNKDTITLHDLKEWKKFKKRMKIKIDDDKYLHYAKSKYPTIIDNFYIDGNYNDILEYVHEIINSII